MSANYVLRKLMLAQLGPSETPNEAKAQVAAEVSAWMATDAYREGQIAMQARVVQLLRDRRNSKDTNVSDLLIDDVEYLMVEELV